MPLLAVVCLLVGLAVGYRIAPRDGLPAVSPAPFPTPSAPEVTPSPVDGVVIWPADGILTYPPTLPTESPPADGLSLQAAIKELQNQGWGLPPATIVSARLDRFGNVGLNIASPPDEWVWVFAIAGDNLGSIVCVPVVPEATADPSADPSASQSVPPIQVGTSPETTICRAEPMGATVVLDYRTGEFIEAQSSSTHY
jgi:hypothetical protein